MAKAQQFELAPGTVFSFADTSQLPAFEDRVVAAMGLNLSPEAWDIWKHRDGISSELKPPKKLGRFTETTLEVVPDPYPRILTIRDRGLKILGQHHRIPGDHRDSMNEDELAEYTRPFVGFLFTALLDTSNQGIIGRVSSELTYYPTEVNRMRGVTRRMTQPVLAAATRIGLQNRDYELMLPGSVS